MPKRNRQILLVEDHQDTQEMMSKLIEMWGYKVFQAETVSGGMKLAKEQEFILYLLDYQLPDGTGIELCKSIREFDSQTPILFCSASAYPFNIEQAIAAGAQGYI